MSKRTGLSGFLAPNGRFYKCGHMEHAKKAQELAKKFNLRVYDDTQLKNEEGFAKFGVDPFNENEDHVFVSPIFPLTEQQLKWIEKHRAEFTPKQIYYLELGLEWQEDLREEQAEKIV